MTDAPQKMITVCLLHGHEVVRRGLVAILDDAPGLTVIGEARTASEALARVPALRPDVAVMAAELPDSDGATVCRALQSRMSALKVIMLSAHSDDVTMVGAILAGAAGYLSSDIRGQDLVAAVRTVADGGVLLPETGLAAVVEHLLREAQAAAPLEKLNERERVVLDFIGEGLTNRQIAERLSLAEKTVKNHVSQVLAKLGLERRSQAAALVTRHRSSAVARLR